MEEKKRFKDLTNSEVQLLTSEEIEKYIKIEKLYNNVPLVNSILEEEKVFKHVPDPTLTLYYHSLLGSNISSKDKEVIELLDKLIEEGKLVHTNYHYASNRNFYYLDKFSQYTDSGILKLNAYETEQLASEARSINEENIKINNEIENNKSNFTEADKIEEEITSRILKIQNRIDLANYYLFIFKTEYLPLADNNKETALKFLTVAYKLDDDIKEYLINEDINCLIVE